METPQTSLPYITIAERYQQRFGGKVYKIPVSVVDDCPNRRGLKGMETCVFCDPWGSAARTETMNLSLQEQILHVKQLLEKRYHPNAYLVYFQAYTNTFTKVSALRGNFEAALSFDFVKGLVVGTRPDCLSKSVLDLWNEFHQRSFLAVELGVQTFFDDQLAFLRRGHTGADSIRAIHKIANETSVDLGIHLMFGNPNETDQQMIETARICNDLPITNVKLHNLHVLKQTPLEQLYLQGQFHPIEMADYARRVGIFLDHLSPRLAVHRLSAYSSRRDELVAPRWTADKMKSYQTILDYLHAEGIYQSRQFSPRDEADVVSQSLLAARNAHFCASTNSSTAPSTVF